MFQPDDLIVMDELESPRLSSSVLELEQRPGSVTVTSDRRRIELSRFIRLM